MGQAFIRCGLRRAIWVLTVAVTLPLCSESAATGRTDEVLKDGNGLSMTRTVSGAQEVHEIALRLGPGFQCQKVASKGGDEFLCLRVPSIEFRDGAKVLELPIGQLQGEAVREQNPKQYPNYSNPASDEGSFVLGHSKLRSLLFALGGGAIGIGLGLLIGRAWLLWMLRKPNLISGAILLHMHRAWRNSGRAGCSGPVLMG